MKFKPVGNDMFDKVAHALGVVSKDKTSDNNVGNQMETLCWVAFEEDQVFWIIGLVWHAHTMLDRNVEEVIPANLRLQTCTGESLWDQMKQCLQDGTHGRKPGIEHIG